MSSLLDDLRITARGLAKNPGFALAALATLALAIGANTAIFSVANGLLLAKPPFPEPDRLVEVQRTFPRGMIPSVSPSRYFFWHQGSKSFASLAVYDDIGSGFNLTGDGRPERIVGSRVSRQFFQVLGGSPALGRTFTGDEDLPAGAKAAILSDGLWRRRFGADRTLVGRQIRLNGEAVTVVGVMPASFRYPVGAELWVPLAADPAGTDIANYLRMIGRLAPGATLESARAEAKVLAKEYGATHKDSAPEESATATTLQEIQGRRLRPALLVLLGAVGLVLLIACVNIANLQLARGAARQREIAIRAALGAGGRRIARQLMTESLVLALAGGGLGVLLGAIAIRPLLALSPVPLAPLAPIGVDGRVLGFALGISLLSGLLFGLAPALQARRVELVESLRQGAGRATAGARALLARRALVIGEVALALVLLVGAALLVRSFVAMTRTAPGFTPAGALSLKISLPEKKYGEPAALERFVRAVVEEVDAIPGARSAAFSSSLPLEGGPDMMFTVPGRDPKAEGGSVDPQVRFVSEEYFAALGIRMVRGRAFSRGDGSGGPGALIINEALAKQIWPKEDALGKSLTLGGPDFPEFSDPRPRTIVGIAADVRESGLEEAAPGVAYLPVGQVPPALLGLIVRLLPSSLVVRGEGDPAALAEAVQKAIWAVDPEQPVTNVLTMSEVVEKSVGSDSFNALLLGLLAMAALALAAIGIYGVLSYLVEQRTRELGVRMALGATAGEVTRLVLVQGSGSVGIGIALGIAGALGLTRLLSSLIYGVGPRDPFAFAVAAVSLGAVALFASLLPARRASRLDPVVALTRD